MSDSPKCLHEWQQVVHNNAKNKGFWDGVDPTDPKVLGTKLMLITCELAEAFEEVRAGRPHHYWKDGKPEGLAVELADVVIRTLDLAAALNIDLYSVMRQKHEYNKTRPHKHGKAC